MRIEPAANSVKRPALKDVANTRSARPSAAASGEGSGATVDTQSINVVLKLITDASKIRESVVNDIKAQVQTGEYLAKQDAYETASSILNL